MEISDEDDRNIIVEAKTINPIHFTYDCPYCYRIRSGRLVDSPFCKRTKRLLSSAVPTRHFHGSGGDLSNRIEHRVSHCTVNDDKGVFIKITNKTKRYK